MATLRRTAHRRAGFRALCCSFAVLAWLCCSAAGGSADGARPGERSSGHRDVRSLGSSGGLSSPRGFRPAITAIDDRSGYQPTTPSTGLTVFKWYKDERKQSFLGLYTDGLHDSTESYSVIELFNDKYQYLQRASIGLNHKATLEWSDERPRSPPALFVTYEHGARFVGSTLGLADSADFYPQLFEAQYHADDTLCRRIYQTEMVHGSTGFYLVNQVDGPSSTLIEFWSQRPFTEPEGHCIALVTQLSESGERRYLAKLTIAQTGEPELQWSESMVVSVPVYLETDAGRCLADIVPQHNWTEVYHRVFAPEEVPDVSLFGLLATRTQTFKNKKYCVSAEAEEGDVRVQVYSRRPSASEVANRVDVVIKTYKYSGALYLENATVYANKPPRLNWTPLEMSSTASVEMSGGQRYLAEFPDVAALADFSLVGSRSGYDAKAAMAIVTEITRNIRGETFHFVEAFDAASAQVQLWSRSPFSARSSRPVDQVIKVHSDEAEYLTRITAWENGRTQLDWSRQPPFGFTVALVTRLSGYVAQAPPAAHWRAFYSQVAAAEDVPDTALLSTFRQVTETMGGRPFYLVDQIDMVSSQYQLWSEVAFAWRNEKRIDLVTHRDQNGTRYLKDVARRLNGTTRLSWSDVPLSEVTVTAVTGRGRYIARVSENANQTDFYTHAVLYGYLSDARLLNLTAQVKKQPDWQSFYLLEQFEDAFAQVQMWSAAPISAANGERVDLIMKTAKEGTEYLATVTLYEDGRTQRYWSTKRIFATTLKVQHPSGSYVAQLRKNENRTAFYRKLTDSAAVPDKALLKALTQVATEIGGQTYYLVEQLDYFPTQIQLWSRAPAGLPAGDRVELVTRKMENTTAYLAYVTVAQDGRAKLDWSPDLVLSTAIIGQSMAEQYVASLPKPAEWAEFYERIRLAEHTPSPSLKNELTQVTRTVRNSTYYLVNQFEAAPTQFQLWSSRPTAWANGNLVSLISRTAGDNTEYLKAATLRNNSETQLHWLTEPPSFVALLLREDDASYVVEVSSPASATRFHTQLLKSAEHFSATLLGSVTKVTMQLNAQTYFLINEFPHSVYRVQFWTRSPRLAEGGRHVDLVVRKAGTVTEYLHSAVITPSGRALLDWRAHSVFYTAILRRSEKGDFVAQLSPAYDWTTFYHRIREAQHLDDESLLSITSQKAAVINGTDSYLLLVADYYDNDKSVSGQVQLWSSSPINETSANKVHSITAEVGGETRYPRSIEIAQDGKAYIHWALEPPLLTAISVQTQSGYHAARLAAAGTADQFYRKLVAALSAADGSLPSMVTQITEEIGGTLYYLLDQFHYAKVGFRVWASAPADSQNGTYVTLVTKLDDSNTEYLRDAIEYQDGKVEDTWIDRRPVSSMFVSFREHKHGRLITPTRDTVRYYIKLEPAAVPVPPTDPADSAAAFTVLSSAAPPLSAESDALASIPANDLWVAPEYRANATFAKSASTLHKFSSALNMDGKRREKAILRLFPRPGGETTSTYKASLRRLIDMDRTQRNEWCEKATSTDEDVASSTECVDACEAIVEDATVLFVKKIQSQYPACKFGLGVQPGFAWSFVLTALALAVFTS